MTTLSREEVARIVKDIAGVMKTAGNAVSSPAVREAIHQSFIAAYRTGGNPGAMALYKYLADEVKDDVYLSRYAALAPRETPGDGPEKQEVVLIYSQPSPHLFRLLAAVVKEEPDVSMAKRVEVAEEKSRDLHVWNSAQAEHLGRAHEKIRRLKRKVKSMRARQRLDGAMADIIMTRVAIVEKRLDRMAVGEGSASVVKKSAALGPTECETYKTDTAPVETAKMEQRNAFGPTTSHAPPIMAPEIMWDNSLVGPFSVGVSEDDEFVGVVEMAERGNKRIYRGHLLGGKSLGWFDSPRVAEKWVEEGWRDRDPRRRRGVE